MIFNTFVEAKKYYRRNGLASLLKKIGYALFWKLIKCELVFVKRVDNVIQDKVKPEITIKLGTCDDFDYVKYYRNISYGEVCRRRQEHNEIAYLALIGGRVAYIMWIRRVNSLSFSFVGQTQIKVPDGSMYIYDCFTLPTYRGRGIYSYMLDYIADLYVGKSCYVACQAQNEPSRKGIVKASFKLCLRLYWLKCGPISLKWKIGN